MVFFQLVHFNNNSSPKEIGYFSSLSHIQNAKNILNDNPGFSTNRDGYIVIRRSNPNVIIGKPFYESLIYYHSEDYSVEYSTTLGFFNNINHAQKAIKDYRELNPSDSPEMICELIVNKCILNEVMWTQGFISE